MENKHKITHQQIVAYLLGEMDEETRRLINKVIKEDPVYKLFFELIKKIKIYVNIREQTAPHPETFLKFSEVEQMLMHFFADQINTNQAQRFLDSLISSPSFYHRLLTKLNPATPEVMLEELPEMAEVRIKSDKQLYEKIVSQVKYQKRKPYLLLLIDRMKQSIIDILKNLKGLFELPTRLPRYAFGSVAIITGILISFSVYRIMKDTRQEYFVYDDKVPYEYDKSSLRSMTENLEKDPMFNSFVDQFKLGISSYMIRDYADAIHIFKNLESVGNKIQVQSKTPEFLPQMRDLYFYLGLSHLALSRSQKVEEEMKLQHNESSIRYLFLADSLALKHKLDGNDRETYFLGLAYGLGGHKELAFNKLRLIKPASNFHKDSAKLIQLWSK